MTLCYRFKVKKDLSKVPRNQPFFSSGFSLQLPDFEQAYGESTEGSGSYTSGSNKKTHVGKKLEEFKNLLISRLITSIGSTYSL